MPFNSVSCAALKPSHHPPGWEKTAHLACQYLSCSSGVHMQRLRGAIPPPKG